MPAPSSARLFAIAPFATAVLAAWLPGQQPWQAVAAGSPPPPFAEGAASTVRHVPHPTDATELLRFGGRVQGVATNATWLWQGADWAPMAQATPPSPRFDSALAPWTMRWDFVLFGGRDTIGVLGDTHVLSNGAWQPRSPVRSPSARAGHAMATLGGRVILFGGEDQNGTPLGDTWAWNGHDWSPITVAGPSARNHCGLATDLARNRIVLFGGLAGPGNALGDTWSFDGAAWSLRTTATAPAPRHRHAQFFDDSRGRIVVAGGRDGSNTDLADVWEWTGLRWLAAGTLPVAGPALGGHLTSRGENVVIAATAGVPAVAAQPTVARGFVSRFGAACSAASYLYPLWNTPTLGQTLLLSFLQPAGAITLGCLGFSRTRTAAGLPLPQPLVFPSATCLQHIDPVAVFYLPGSPWGVPIPNRPELGGMRFFGQLLHHGGGAFADASNGVECQIAGPTDATIVEDFHDETMLDRDGSGGTWSLGVATFSPIGGDGRHGPFDPAYGHYLGVIAGRHTYAFHTDFVVIPNTATLDGQPAIITDGRFSFSEMTVPADHCIQFRGSQPAEFTVRGSVRILGVLEADGQTPTPVAQPATTPQPGGRGGPGGAAGGAGAERCQGNGASPLFDGLPGGDVWLPAGHTLASGRAGTGGRGSSLFPASGLAASIVYSSTIFGFSFQAAAGGGGGGLWTAGGDGRVVSNSVPDPLTGVPPHPGLMGPSARGGSALSLLPVPAGTRSAHHFLVGGSGGAGGGSSPAFANNITRLWAPGSGGGGGGGALSVRAGHDLLVAATARLGVRGGSGGSGSVSNPNASQPAPGGGGSGGSIVLQAGGTAGVVGVIDVRGGSGGVMDASTVIQPPTGGRLVVHGGDGGDGIVRLETRLAPLPGALPQAMPPATASNVGPLTDTDPLAGFQSRFYRTGVATPAWTRFEATLLTQNGPFTYTTTQAGNVQFWVQGADLDPVSGTPIPGTLTPWLRAVAPGDQPSLADHARSAVRFLAIVDRSRFPAPQIDQVVFRWRH